MSETKPTALENRGLTIEDLTKAYHELKSIYKVAEKYQISTATVSRRLSDVPKYGSKPPKRRHGQLTEWKRKHPDVSLPLGQPKRVSEITGCSYHAVRNEIYRRRKRYRKRLRELIIQELQKRKILQDVEGDHLKVKDIHSITLPNKLPFSRDVIVKVEMKDKNLPATYVEFHYSGGF